MELATGQRYACFFWTLTLNAFVSTAVYLGLCSTNVTDCGGEYCACVYIERYTLCSVISFVLLVLWHCYRQKVNNVDYGENYLQPLPIFADESEFEGQGRRSGSKEKPLQETDTMNTLPRTSVPEDFECAICNEAEKEKVVQLPCEHMFHRECVLKWFSADSKKTCPICRDSQVPVGRLLVITIIPREGQPRTSRRLTTVV